MYNHNRVVVKIFPDKIKINVNLFHNALLMVVVCFMVGMLTIVYALLLLDNGNMGGYNNTTF